MQRIARKPTDGHPSSGDELSGRDGGSWPLTDRESIVVDDPYHIPVLVEEVLTWLDAAPGKSFVDGTLGGGGHAEAILERTGPDGRLLGIDRDPMAREEAASRLERFGDRVEIVAGNYGDVTAHARGFGPADGFLVDAGVSSRQLDDPDRGFSFREAGPLDMRMGPEAPTLEEYLSAVDEDDLAGALRAYGEVRGARRIAREILVEFRAGHIRDTAQLAEVVARVAPGRGGARRRTRIHPATLVFQALRIAVNEELDALERAVEAVPIVVRAGGRAVFISFHSLEDRIVKQGFRDLASDCVCPPGLPECVCDAVAQVSILTSRPVRATQAEIESNPRARSAKLRAVEVL